MNFWFRRLGLPIALFWVAVAFAPTLQANRASSSQAVFEVAVDNDNSVATGCPVTFEDAAGVTVDNGFERLFRITVERGAAAVTVVSTEVADCDPMTGIFGAATPIAGGWPVGLGNGVNGADVVEAELPSALIGNPNFQVKAQAAASPVLRLGLQSRTGAGGADTLRMAVNGGPLQFPPRDVEPIPTLSEWGMILMAALLAGAGLWLLRKRQDPAVRAVLTLAVVGLGAVTLWAATITLDGLVDDWAGESPLATDPLGDAALGDPAAEIVAVFVSRGSLFFRIDVQDLEQDPPVAVDDSDSTDEDMAVSIPVLANDSDPDVVDTLTVTMVTQGANGAVTIDPGAQNVTYTPVLNFNGPDAFAYTVSDNTGLTATADVTVNVGAVDDPPMAVDDMASVNEDAPFVDIDVLANDSDAEGPLTVISFTQGANGTVTDQGGGVLRYAPNPDFFGPDGFSYTAQNSGATTDTANVAVTVNPVNDAPAFSAGPNQSVNQNDPAQSVPNWATGISPGPANEAGQTVNFLVTNDNNGLFSAQPAVDSSGTLTYTPAVGQNGVATVTVRAMDDGGTANGGVDTSPPQTFDISIIFVNQEPSFTPGADPTVLEDAGPQTVAGWATNLDPGAPDESGQTLTFVVTGNTNPGLFSAGPAVSGVSGDLTFTSAADANGSADVTIELRDNGGTANGGDDTSPPATFTINVTPVNDEPSFTDGADETVLEDSGARTVMGWATSISPGPPDESGQTVSFNITGNTNMALFAVAPAVSPTGTLTYTPAADAAGTATITLELMDDGGTANGGDDTSPPQMFDITVTGVNDEPSFTKGADQAVLEDAGAQTVMGWATAISPGPPDEAGQTVSFNVTGNTNPGLFAAGPAVSSAGVLTYTPAADANGTATITIEAMDDGGTANGGDDTSPPQTFDITVTAVNDAPSFTAGANQSVNEDSGAQTVMGWATAISAGPPDEAGQTLSFNVTGNTNMALFAVAPAVSPTGTLTYTPAGNAAGTATITLELMDDGGTANGGDDTSPPQMFDITVTGINDAPSFTAGPNQTVNEDAGAQTVMGWATAISPGPPDEAGQTVSFNVTGNTNPGLFSAGPAVSSAGVLTYTPAADANGSATITLVAMDDGGTANGGVDTSPPQMFDINVTAVNDPPTLDAIGNETVCVNAPTQSVSLTGISSGAANEAQTLMVSAVSDNPGLVPNPTVMYTSPNATGTLQYSPVAGMTGIAVITVTVDDGGGVNNTVMQMFTVTVLAAPVAADDGSMMTPFASTNTDTPLMVAAPGVLANDTNPTASITPLTATSTACTANPMDCTAPNVALAADGSFTYTPPTGFTGLDTFDYTLLNNGVPAMGAGDCADSATVTVEVGLPPTAVDDVFAGGALGNVRRSSAGLLNVQDNDMGGAATIDAFGFDADMSGGLAGMEIGVTQNGGTVTGLMSMGNFTGEFLYNPPPGFEGTDFFDYEISNGSGSDLGRVSVTVADMIWFVDNTAMAAGDGRLTNPFNTLAAFEAANGGGGAADPAAGECIFLHSGSGNYTGGVTLLDNQTLVGQGASGTVAAVCGVAPPAGSDALPVLGGTRPRIEDATATGISLAADNTVRGLDVGNTPNGNALAGATVGALSVSEVALDEGTGATRTGGAVSLAGGGAINVVLDRVESLNATGDGINLNTVGGSFVANAGSIEGSVGNAVDINAGDGAVTYAGGITNTSNRSVEVTGRTGGAVTLSGNINDTGTGINVANNTGGSTTFSGTSKVLNTGGNQAVTLATNAGHTVNFTNGGLDIDTSGAATGFNATGGGTVTVTGSTNTINTNNAAGTGIGLNVSSTNIGLAGMTFQRIRSVGGGNVGISLSNTGTAMGVHGGLTVTGTGAAGSGGAIANKTGADASTTAGIGIFLNQTRDVSLTRMQLNDFQNFAIRGTSVTNFTMNDTVINGVNGTSTAADEGSVSFFNLLGSAAVSNSNVSGGLEDNILVINDTGTLNRLTVSGGTIGLNSTASGNDGVSVESRSSSTLNLTVSGVSFTGARGDMVQCNAIQTSTMDCVVRDNTFNNTHPNIVPGGGGITLAGGGMGSNFNMTYDVSGTTPGAQTFQGADGNAVTVNFVSGGGVASGAIRNNTIGTATAGSGSLNGSGVLVGASGSVTHSVEITGNLIRGIGGPASFAGIDVNTTGSGTVNADITGNTINGFSSFTLAGINAISGGGSSSDTSHVCLHISGNTIDASGSFGLDYFIDQINFPSNSTSTYNFPGYAGPAVPGLSPNALDALLVGQNTLMSGGGDSSATRNVSGTGAECVP